MRAATSGTNPPTAHQELSRKRVSPLSPPTAATRNRFPKKERPPSPTGLFSKSPPPAARLPGPSIQSIQSILLPVLSVVDFCHQLLRPHLHRGDWAADATAGNGHDTLFLARLVAPAGKVFACDLQPQAVEATRALLAANGIPSEVCQPVAACHSVLADWLPPEASGRLAAAIFNLGYLPGGDKTVITRPETTLSAVTSVLDLLRPGGLLLIVLYPGHPGGDAEAATLRQWAAELPAKTAHASEFHTLNVRHPAPSVLIVHKSPKARAPAPTPAQPAGTDK